MKHWTHDVVPAAGVALVGSGVALALVADVWGGVVCIAFGVALLLGLRALEFRTATLKALDVVEVVTALQAQVRTLEQREAKTAEDAATALRGLSTVRSTPRAPGY